RIRERMELAFGNSALSVPLVDSEISVTNGQVRLINPAVRVDRVGITPGGRIDLADQAIDARLLVSGPEVAGAPDGTRPEVAIVLKGPLDTPRRMLDVTNFASWLALRAVDQQARRVDLLEQARRNDPP